MFSEMHRKKQKLSKEECDRILDNGTSGVLALHGVNGYPYAVPVSYVYNGEKLLFHSAKNGHKIDAILKNAAASFCVIDQDQIVPEEYTTYFRSIIAFGRIRILEDDAEKRSAIEKLAVKYAPDDTAEHRDKAIEREWKPLCLMEMEIENLMGKQALEMI